MTARSVFWAFAGALRPLSAAAAAKAIRHRRKWPIVYSSWLRNKAGGGRGRLGTSGRITQRAVLRSQSIDVAQPTPPPRQAAAVVAARRRGSCFRFCYDQLG